MDELGYSNGRRPQALLSRKNYFLAYNGICLVLWGIVTLRAIFLIPLLVAHDHLYGLYEALHSLLTFTQSIAILEVVHSLVGIVRANPLTTAMQVASRLLLVWGVVGAFPEIVVTSRTFGVRVQQYAGTKGGPYAYAGMLLAWGITECIRYGFFVWKEGLGVGGVPKWLTWLRYVGADYAVRVEVGLTR
jgi:very-long-chain (3R)-3-hydroxyacyl-CoA dehydratase